MPVRRRRFAARRKAVGLSQEQLAECLRVDRSTVGRWESGETEPQPWVRPNLARALRISMDELNGLLTQHDLADNEAERLSHALANPGSADLVTVAHLRQQVEQLDEQYVRVPSTLLLADAGQCVGQIGFLTTHARNLRVRRELRMVEAEAAVLMGQLVWDASQRRDHATAHVFFDRAIAAASQSGHAAVEGLAWLRKSMVALYGEKNPAEGLTMTLQATEVSRRVSNVLTGLALLHVAESYAMLGEVSSCESALREAESQLGRLSSADAATSLFSPSLFGRMAGSCYLFLDDARRARRFLAETAPLLQDNSKSQAIVLGNLALASIRLGNLDEATSRLHQAIDVIEMNWSGGGLNIVFGAGRELHSWRSQPAVRDVQDRLLGLMAAA
jgi:transcriptional regulator with XRE-family HTH domain